jgi:hypothetical protein
VARCVVWQHELTSLICNRHNVLSFSISGQSQLQLESVSRKKQNERKERNIMRKSASQKGKSPSRMIDERIKELDDWRGKMLSRLRTLIKQADP